MVSACRGHRCVVVVEAQEKQELRRPFLSLLFSIKERIWSVGETEFISITRPIRTCTTVVVHSSISGTLKDRSDAVIVPRPDFRMSALCSRVADTLHLEAGLPLPCCVGYWSSAGICLRRAEQAPQNDMD